MARIFEDLSISYLAQLKTDGTIINGDLIGVNEVLETSQAKVMIVGGDNTIEEKYIVIYKLNDNLTWGFYKKADEMFLYDYSSGDWTYPNFPKRIVAPVSLVLNYSSFETWFRMNNLPIVKKENTLYCYCNNILPEHQALVDSLSGQITIEDKPA